LINLIAATDNSEIREYAIENNSVQKWHICQKNCIWNR